MKVHYNVQQNMNHAVPGSMYNPVVCFCSRDVLTIGCFWRSLFVLSVSGATCIVFLCFQLWELLNDATEQFCALNSCYLQKPLFCCSWRLMMFTTWYVHQRQTIAVSNNCRTVTRTSITLTKTCTFQFQLTSIKTATNKQNWQKKNKYYM